MNDMRAWLRAQIMQARRRSVDKRVRLGSTPPSQLRHSVVTRVLAVLLCLSLAGTGAAVVFSMQAWSQTEQLRAQAATGTFPHGAATYAFLPELMRRAAGGSSQAQNAPALMAQNAARQGYSKPEKEPSSAKTAAAGQGEKSAQQSTQAGETMQAKPADPPAQNTAGSSAGISSTAVDPLQPKQAEQPPQQITVYITKTGECYHSGNCHHLNSSKIPIALDDAKKNFRRCSQCNAPR